MRRVFSCGVLLACLLLACPLWAGELTVSAASSLTDAFREIATQYERDYPRDKVRLNFAASGVLLQQIANGAPVDVLATADQQTMDQAQAQRWVRRGDRLDFARNHLVVVVPQASKLQIRRLADLAQPGVNRIALANPATVPVGRYARDALAANKVLDAIVFRAVLTQNVRQSLQYVANGDVDAAFVYETDAAIGGDDVRVAFSVHTRRPILYPIAVTSASANRATAIRFMGFVRSRKGQSVLRKYGFGLP